jgi:hypothetical protein
MALFSRRNDKPHDRYTYVVSEKVRSRIFHTLAQHRGDYMGGGRYNFTGLLEEVGQKLLTHRGGLLSSQARHSNLGEAVADHFFVSSDEEAMDFVQLCFETETMGGNTPDAHTLVKAVNRVLEEEGVGYELTTPSMIDTGEPAQMFGRQTGRNYFRIEYARVIKKNELTVHQQVVKPALEALRDPRLATANGELLNAFDKVRKGDYADAITSCGSAFESVLKTICDIKGWAYDPKDTCSKLVGVCRQNGLFFPLYAPMFEAVGTVRNNLGDAHGRGPKPVHVATRDHAEHMIAMTSAHIDFLVRQAAI